MAVESDFEFYLYDTEAVTKTNLLSGRFWSLSVPDTNPEVHGELVVVSRSHGTLVYKNEEYTILSVLSLCPTRISVLTSIEPDQHNRILVNGDDQSH